MPSNFINSIFHFNKFISWSNYDPHRIAKFTLISFAVHGRDPESIALPEFSFHSIFGTLYFSKLLKGTIFEAVHIIVICPI